MALTRDIERILPILSSDINWAAYAICDLEEPEFSECEWHVDRDSLVLVYYGLHIPLLVPFGVLTSSLLRDARAHASRFLINFRIEHASEVEGAFRISETHPVFRMVLKDLLPTPQGALPERVIPLSMARLPELVSLYATGGGPIFTAAHLALGYFYGVERDGVLVSVAGVHSVSRKYGVGTVGNVATHPDYRGRGLAKACTRAVAEQLRRDGIDTIVLNADADNEPAVRAYKRLGFVTCLEYQDGIAES